MQQRMNVSPRQLHPMPIQSSLPAARPVPFSLQRIEKALKVDEARLGYTGYNLVNAL